MKELTIIVPVYNAAGFLRKFITSLSVIISNIDCEVFFIDDGSVDDSKIIIKEFAEKNSKLNLIENEHGGVSRARNTGLERAQGRYIYFADADDTLEKDIFNFLLAPMKNDPEIDMSIGRFKFSTYQKEFTGDNKLKGVLSKQEFLEHFIKNADSYYYGVIWNKIYKNDILTKYHLRFPEGIEWCEDFLFNLEYYDKCEKIYYTNNVIYEYYFITGTKTTSRLSGERWQELADYRYAKYLDFLRKYGMPEEGSERWQVHEYVYSIHDIVKKRKDLSLSQRYKLFREKMLQEETKQKMKQYEESKSTKLVRIEYFMYKKKLLWPLFTLLLIKGNAGELWSQIKN